MFQETRGLIAAMIGGGQKQPACLSGRVTEDSFTRGRYEDLGSLDDIDQSQEDISNVTMKTSQGDIHTDGKLSQEDSDHDNDSSSSLSASGGNTDSLDCGGKRRSPPHADMTDTGDTVIFRGAAILPDGGITARPHSHESGHSELSGGERPSTDGQTPSSLNISNDCRSGAVLPHSSEEEINYQVSNDGSEVSLPQKSTVMHCRSDALSSKPQNQLSTSKKSQVLRADVVKDNHVASDPTGRTSYNSRCPPPASSNSREPLSSSMLPGQRVQNGGPHWVGQHSDPQGDSNLVAGTTRHNHIPHSSSPTLGGGATTLAELPQDVKKSRSDSSSLKRHHYNV